MRQDGKKSKYSRFFQEKKNLCENTGYSFEFERESMIDMVCEKLRDLVAGYIGFPFRSGKEADLAYFLIDSYL